MQWVSRWTNRFSAPRELSGRQAQFLNDTALIYKLCRGESPCTQNPVSNSDVDELSQFEDKVNTISTLFSRKAISLFQRASIPASAGKRANSLGDVVNSNQTLQSPVFSFRKGKTAGHQRENQQFSVRVAPSSIPGAGQGVFVDGRAEQGDLLTIYPGITYRPSDARHMDGYPEISKGNDYLMWRYDGIIVDGSPSAIQWLIGNGYGGSEGGIPLESYAAGQFINHPPPGSLPNALQYSLDITSLALSPDLHHMIPNMPFHKIGHSYKPEPTNSLVERLAAKLLRRDGTFNQTLDALVNSTIRQRVSDEETTVTAGFVDGMRSIDIKSIAIIATRTIEDEEVFINYRLNPHLPELPPWYEDCDPIASKRRWSKDGFWM